jgi:hypothetical protein
MQEPACDFDLLGENNSLWQGVEMKRIICDYHFFHDWLRFFARHEVAEQRQIKCVGHAGIKPWLETRETREDGSLSNIKGASDRSSIYATVV